MAKDPRLTLIDVAVPRFLIEPPPPGPQDAGISSKLAAKILYSQKETIPSDKEQEEPAFEPTYANIEKDFEVFNRVDTGESSEFGFQHRVIAQVSTNQKAIDILEGMVLEEKTPDLLALRIFIKWKIKVVSSCLG